MRRRILSVFLFLIFFSSGLVCFKSNQVKAISDFYVKINPPIIRSIAEYEFHFKLSKTLPVHDWFHITFPPGTEFNPPIPEEGMERKIRLKQIVESFVLDSKSCEACQGMPHITYLEDGSMQIRLSSPVELNPFIENYQETVIQIKNSAGIMNPSTPGEVTFSIRTQHEETFTSQPVELFDSSQFKMDVTPPLTGQIADYSFHLKPKKEIQVRHKITLLFPPGTVLTPPLPEQENKRKERLFEIASAFYIDGSSVGACIGLPLIIFNEDGSMSLQFYNPLMCDPNGSENQDLFIKITKEAGITNPSNPGIVHYYYKTENEPEYVESRPIELLDSVPSAKLTNSKAGETTGMEIQFFIGPLGEMKCRRGNYYYLEFPKSFILMKWENRFQRYSYDMISINGIPLLEDPWVAGEYQNILALPVIKSVKANDMIKISIDERYGIQNPFTAGDYTLSIYTQAEQKKVKSTSFQIQPSDFKAHATVKPSRTNQEANIKLIYLNEKEKINAKEQIDILFPKEFNIPNRMNKGFVMVNNRVVSKTRIKDNIIEITSPIAIEKDDNVRIQFKDFGITTPAKPGNYQFSITHKKNNSTCLTNYVFIEETILEITDLDLSCPNADEKSIYDITVSFHPDRIPKIGDSFQVNLEFLQAPIEWTIVESLGSITVIKLENIQNPKPGKYSLSIKTSTEKAEYPNKVLIIPPLPTTKIKFAGGKEGKNGWFTEIPEISFEYDDPDSFLLYDVYGYNPFTEEKGRLTPKPSPSDLQPGQFVSLISYFSFNAYGSEKTKEFLLKVDSIPPIVTISNPSVKSSKQNTNTILVEGKITPIKMCHYQCDQLIIDKNLTINGIETEVRGDGFFLKELSLLEGNNTIQIKAEDEAGNSVQYDYEVFVDTKAPTLIVEAPFDGGEVFLTNMITIKGIIESDALLLIDRDVIHLKEDGSFATELPIDTPGKKELKSTASDKLNNQTIQIFNCL